METAIGRVDHIIGEKAVIVFQHGLHIGRVEVVNCDLQVGDEIEVEIAQMAFPDPGTPPISMGWRPFGVLKVKDEIVVGGRRCRHR